MGPVQKIMYYIGNRVPFWGHTRGEGWCLVCVMLLRYLIRMALQSSTCDSASPPPVCVRTFSCVFGTLRTEERIGIQRASLSPSIPTTITWPTRSVRLLKCQLCNAETQGTQGWIQLGLPGQEYTEWLRTTLPPHPGHGSDCHYAQTIRMRLVLFGTHRVISLKRGFLMNTIGRSNIIGYHLGGSSCGLRV